MKDDLNRLLEEACSGGEWPIIEKLLVLRANPTGQSDYPPSPDGTAHQPLRVEDTTFVGYRSELDLEKALGAILTFADKGTAGTRRKNMV